MVYGSLSSPASQCSVQEVSAVVEEQFARLQKTVEEAKQGAAEVLEGERRQALSQAESIQTHLEQKRAELLKILSQMSKLTRSKSDVVFLQVGNTRFELNPDAFTGVSPYVILDQCRMFFQMLCVCGGMLTVHTD